MQRIRVVIADDQELVRAGFAMVIGSQQDMQVVGQARDGADAVRVAESLHPDVVLMDVRMPGMDGIEATRRITALESGAAEGTRPTRVIILTTFDLDEYVMAAINAGASGLKMMEDGYTKPHPVPEAAPAAPVYTDPELDELTDREREVLIEIAHGLSNQEIADKLFISLPTVKTHVAHILAKINARDRVQAVVFAYDNHLV